MINSPARRRILDNTDHTTLRVLNGCRMIKYPAPPPITAIEVPRIPAAIWSPIVVSFAQSNNELRTSQVQRHDDVSNPSRQSQQPNSLAAFYPVERERALISYSFETQNALSEQSEDFRINQISATRGIP